MSNSALGGGSVSAPVNIGMRHIETMTIGSAVQTFDFGTSSLGGTRYKLIGHIVNDNASAANYAIYANGVNTATNYEYTRASDLGAPSYASGTNRFGICAASADFTFEMNIIIARSLFRAMSEGFRDSDDISYQHKVWNNSDTMATITALRIAGDQTSSLGVGSSVSLYEMETV